MDDTQTDIYSQRVARYSERIGDFDRLRLRLKADKESNNSDTATTEHKWIDRYFESVSLRFGSRKQLEYPRSQIKDDSIDLTASLKMFSQEASCVAGNWTDVKRKYDDRRSFRRFLLLLGSSGLDTYPFKKDKGYQLSRLLPQKKWADVVISDKYHDGSLSLIQLLRRIHSEPVDEFRREQAKSMESFLDHLITIQKEQLLVAHSFSGRLERLRRFDVVPFSSNAVDDGFVWTRRNILDSIYIMSRESAWLLEGLDSGSTSHPSIKECREIIRIVLDFVSGPKNHFVNDARLVGEHLRRVKKQGGERESVVEMLLGCFVDVFDTFLGPLMPSRGTPSSLQTAGDTFLDTYYSLESAFRKAVIDTSELMSETEIKLSSVYCSDLTSGGSPLGCIVLWRILFESSLIDLRLDRIYEKLSETAKLGFKLLEAASSKKRTRKGRAKLRVVDSQLNQTSAQLDRLLKACSRLLDEWVAMTETVAKVTYTLGDAFTTGGAGTRDLSAGSFNVDYSSVVADDFPWDKHIVRVGDGKNARCGCRDYDVDGLGSRRWFRKRF